MGPHQEGLHRHAQGMPPLIKRGITQIHGSPQLLSSCCRVNMQLIRDAPWAVSQLLCADLESTAPAVQRDFSRQHAELFLLCRTTTARSPR